MIKIYTSWNINSTLLNSIRQIRRILLGICILFTLNLYSQTRNYFDSFSQTGPDFNPFQNVYPVTAEKYKNTEIHFSLYGVENSTYSEDKYYKFDSKGRLNKLIVDYKWKKETWKYQYKKDVIIIKKYNARNIVYAKEIIKKDTMKSEHFLNYTSTEYARKILFWKRNYSMTYIFFENGLIEDYSTPWTNYSYLYIHEIKIREFSENHLCNKEIFYENENLGFCNVEEIHYGNINKYKTRFHIQINKYKTD